MDVSMALKGMGVCNYVSERYGRMQLCILKYAIMYLKAVGVCNYVSGRYGCM